MARLPRLVLAGEAHLIVLEAQAGRLLCRDDEDRSRFLGALREAALLHRVAVQAWALLDDECWLLATPQQAQGLGACIQATGRRYVAMFHRRHGGAGALWAGRFRCGLVQGGEWSRLAMLAVDLRPVQRGVVAAAADHPWSSARHHLGLARDPLGVASPAYWALGNTPFDRETAYRALLDEGLPDVQWRQLTHAARHGWVAGDAAFRAALAAGIDRPLAPRPRGRPRKTVA